MISMILTNKGFLNLVVVDAVVYHLGKVDTGKFKTISTGRFYIVTICPRSLEPFYVVAYYMIGS